VAVILSYFFNSERLNWVKPDLCSTISDAQGGQCFGFVLFIDVSSNSSVISIGERGVRFLFPKGILLLQSGWFNGIHGRDSFIIIERYCTDLWPQFSEEWTKCSSRGVSERRRVRVEEAQRWSKGGISNVPFRGLSKDAEQLIDQLSLACKDHLSLPFHHREANAVHSSVAIAIQRGNALAIQAGYSRAVMRASRGGQRAA